MAEEKTGQDYDLIVGGRSVSVSEQRLAEWLRQRFLRKVREALDNVDIYGDGAPCPKGFVASNPKAVE